MSAENIEYRSLCPIATGLDVFGDKWTLLVLRDMLFHKKVFFNDLKDSIEGIPSKMLSNRLKKLECLGFISRNEGVLNKKNVYYLLEKKGIETLPFLVELMLFTTKFFYDHLGKTYTKDVTNRMAKDKATYMKEVVDEYNQFKKRLLIEISGLIKGC
jgi:DNA-binding HxlR family transcriptional regulator